MALLLFPAMQAHNRDILIWLLTLQCHSMPASSKTVPQQPNYQFAMDQGKQLQKEFR